LGGTVPDPLLTSVQSTEVYPINQFHLDTCIDVPLPLMKKQLHYFRTVSTGRTNRKCGIKLM
jgi:hypothetical protein